MPTGDIAIHAGRPREKTPICPLFPPTKEKTFAFVAETCGRSNKIEKRDEMEATCGRYAEASRLLLSYHTRDVREEVV